MERRLCLLLVIVAMPALALDPSEKLAQCNEESLDCKENCTIDYGTSFKLRGKLTKCVSKCAKKLNSCRSTAAEYEQAGLDVPDEPKPRANKKEELAPVLEVEHDHSTSTVTSSSAPTEKVEEAPVVEETKVEEAPRVKAEEKTVEEAPPEKPKKVETARAVEKSAKKATTEEQTPPPPPAPKKKKLDLDQWEEGDIDR